MDQSHYTTHQLPGMEFNGGANLTRAETGVVARIKSMEVRSARRQQESGIMRDTLPLFSNYEIKLAKADHSNLVSIYDAIPRFQTATKTVRDMHKMTTQLEGTLNGEPFKVIMKAVSLELPVKVNGKLTGTTEWVGVYPGSREECVEEALRKFSTQAGKFLPAECAVRFTLYELRSELSSLGHSYSYKELRQALVILNESNLTIQTRTADGDSIDIKSTYLPTLFLRSSNKQSKHFIESKDMADEDRSTATQCVAVLHPLISRSIERGDYRLYHYNTSMRLTNSLAKILNRELSMCWRNASPKHPYTFSMISFLTNTSRGLSARIPEDFRAMNIALKQLVDEGVLTEFSAKPVKKLKGKGAMDYVYSVLPTSNFVGMIIDGHRSEKARAVGMLSA